MPITPEIKEISDLVSLKEFLTKDEDPVKALSNQIEELHQTLSSLQDDEIQDGVLNERLAFYESIKKDSNNDLIAFLKTKIDKLTARHITPYLVPKRHSCCEQPIHNMHCCRCKKLIGRKKEKIPIVDPYQFEVNHDDTLHVICYECRNDSKDDI